MRGRDRFRFDDKRRGSFICGQRGTLAGDGFATCSMSATVPPLMRWRWCVTWYAIQWGRTRQERPANDEPEVKAHQKKGTREKPQVKPA